MVALAPKPRRGSRLEAPSSSAPPPLRGRRSTTPFWRPLTFSLCRPDLGRAVWPIRLLPAPPRSGRTPPGPAHAVPRVRSGTDLPRRETPGISPPLSGTHGTLRPTCGFDRPLRAQSPRASFSRWPAATLIRAREIFRLERLKTVRPFRGSAGRAAGWLCGVAGQSGSQWLDGPARDAGKSYTSIGDSTLPLIDGPAIPLLGTAGVIG